jgi:Chaperone of endosialidase
MTLTAKPNSFVVVGAEPMKLSVGLLISPAPLTVSIPGEDPVLGSLEFVITNSTTEKVAVNSVTFTLEVGTGASITPTTAGIATAVSDPNDWIVVGPSSPVTSGQANYVLQPAFGSSVSLQPGGSVVVQIFQIQTNTAPGNSTVTVKEMVSNSPSSTTFLVSTFPKGFYFNGLAATVKSGGALAPCAQVKTGEAVTLVWNSSVVDMGAFAIYYSDAAKGQQKAIPTVVGEWVSPPLTSDTVFTVVVQVSMEGGEPLTASLSTDVSVQNPTLIAANLTAGKATISGPGVTLTAAGIAADSLKVTSLTATGATNLLSLDVQGPITSHSTVNVVTLSASNTIKVTGTFTAENNVVINGNMTVGAITANAGIVSANHQIRFGQNFGVNVTDSFTYNNQKTGWYSVGWFQDSWFQYGPTAWISGYGGIKFFTGAKLPAFTIDYSGNCLYYGSLAKASSMDYKENIRALTTGEASDILNHLDPVQYRLKSNPDERNCLGFIAEHVPSAVAAADGKAIIPDEIVAVLTRVLKDQQEMIQKLERKVDALEAKNRL